MADPLGLRRLMASETNISDLLQYLTYRDPAAWSRVVANVVTAERESRIGSRQRADLILVDVEGNAVAAVEVKLGHSFGEAQSSTYAETFESEVPLLLAGLDVDGAAAGMDEERWTFMRLADLFALWTNSKDVEAAAVASAASRVLEHWTAILASALGPRAEGIALSTIEEPFLARILTRALRTQWRERGADRVWADVTSGGGNALLQAFTSIPGEEQGREFIAEVRWNLAKQTMDLRFGLDFPSGSQHERAAIWEVATRMDDVIRADRFIEHLEQDQSELAELVTSRGSGRPRAKGDWSEIVERGFNRGDAKLFNPGFYRDKDTRLEATARVDLEHAVAEDLADLLRSALSYLKAGAETAGRDR